MSDAEGDEEAAGEPSAESESEVEAEAESGSDAGGESGSGAEPAAERAPEPVAEPGESGADEPAAERTPVAERGARTADGRAGEISDAVEGGFEDAVPAAKNGAAGSGEDVSDATDVPVISGADGVDGADGADGVGGADGVDGADDADDAADPAPGADPAAEPDSAPAEDTGAMRAEVRKALLRPLVSDLPADRPVGRTGGAQGRTEPPWGAPAVIEGPAAPAAPPGPVPTPAAAEAEEGQEEVLGPEGTRALPVQPTSGTTGATPLKLLAQLTNTPPPRQTALRSTVRRFKIWTPLVVLLAVVFVIVQAVRPLPAPTLKLTAAPSYTFAGAALPGTMPWPAEGQSVAEVEGLGSLGVHGAQTPVPIASLTKVMTAYVVLRDHPLTGKQNGPLIPVDQQAAAESTSSNESTAHVTAGQKFTERQMLQLLLVPSGNNIARLLARWDSGTQEAFVAKMTGTAKSLGMAHTTYTGASGYEETTVSTSVDQLALARAVMKNEVFRSVVALPNVDIPGVGTIYNNNNDLVKVGVVGIKTGSSTPAGGALMWAAHKTVRGKQQLILGVVLQQHGGTTVNDSLQTALDRSQKLIESVQGGLTAATIVKKGDVVGEISDGLGGSTPVVAAKDLTAVGWPGMKAEVALTAAAAGLPHHAKAGTQVGTVSFGTGTARTSVPVILKTDLSAPTFTKKLIRLS